MRSFLLGVAICAISIVLSLLLDIPDLIIGISGITTIIAFVIAFISSGILAGNYQFRNNYESTSHENTNTRNKIAFKAFLIGLPNLILVMVNMSMRGLLK